MISRLNSTSEGLLNGSVTFNTNENKNLENKNGTANLGTDSVNNTYFTPPHSRGQSLTITVASLAVAIAIAIFIVVAYKFHVLQLDAKRKEFAEQLKGCTYPSPCLSCSPRRSDSQNAKLLRISQSQSEPDHVTSLTSGRRKSLRTPTPPLLSPPTSLGSKRGSRCSTWSSLSDQDVLGTSSPRRHSTFIL